MFRSLKFALLVGAALLLNGAKAWAQEPKKALDITIAGQIVEGDAKDTVRQFPCKVHVVKLEKGKTYKIDMVSTDFDSFLRLEDSAGKEVAMDDDSGGMLHAQIKYVATKDDSFKIIATTFSGGEGNYTLTVKDTEAAVVAGKEPIKGKKVEPKDGAIKLDVPTTKKGVAVKGELKDGDAVDPGQNHPCKTYAVEFAEGGAYTIEMNSADFDSFLRLLDGAGNELAKDDDSGGMLNSKIEFKSPAKGTYKIVATSFDGGLGAYELVVTQTGEKKEAQKKEEGKKEAGGKEKEGVTKLDTPTAKKGIDIEGKLKDGDPVDPVQNHPAKVYAVELLEGNAYTILMNSTDFDCFLRLVDAGGKELAQDDDGGGMLNSKIEFTPTAKGTYKIVATSFDGGLGAYQLVVTAVEKNAAGKEKVKAGGAKLETPTAKKGIDIGGALKDGDPVDPVQNHPCKNYTVELLDGVAYTIGMNSNDFDCFLRLVDAGGKELDQDDDGGGMLNSKIEFTPSAKGTYTIVATSFDGGLGDFRLTITAVEKGKAGKEKAGGGAKLDTPTAKKPIDMQAKLADGDPVDPALKHPCKNYSVELLEGVTYTIEMNSTDFDCFLRLLDAAGKELDRDDDGGGNLNSKIVFMVPKKGIYTIVTSSFDGGLGGFQLVITPDGQKDGVNNQDAPAANRPRVAPRVGVQILPIPAVPEKK